MLQLVHSNIVHKLSGDSGGVGVPFLFLFLNPYYRGWHKVGGLPILICLSLSHMWHMLSENARHMCHDYPLVGSFHLGVGIRMRMDGWMDGEQGMCLWTSYSVVISTILRALTKLYSS